MPIVQVSGKGSALKKFNKTMNKALTLDDTVNKYFKKFNYDEELMIVYLLTNSIQYEEWIDFYTCFNSCRNTVLISAIADAEVVVSTIKKKVDVALKKRELKNRVDSREKDKYSKIKK